MRRSFQSRLAPLLWSEGEGEDVAGWNRDDEERYEMLLKLTSCISVTPATSNKDPGGSAAAKRLQR
jgi:hypothetical protein